MSDRTYALVLLAAGDDVMIAVRDLDPGVHRASTGDDVDVVEPVRLGHKVAVRSIDRGERVKRCGVPIGSTSTSIAAGAWVHTHNLASDYIATRADRGGPP